MIREPDEPAGQPQALAWLAEQKIK